MTYNPQSPFITVNNSYLLPRRTLSMRFYVFTFFVLSALVFALNNTARADENALSASSAQAAQKLLHILDYVSVEYGNIVVDGKVLDKGEYEEQMEFSQQFLTHLKSMPEGKARQTLRQDGIELQQLIRNKGSAKQLSQLCANMSGFIIESYQVVITPRRLPELNGVAALFQQNCAACHGEQGFGDGVQAAGLEPKPANFHAQERQQFRSVYSLYNTISMGVNGTAMRNFNTELSDEQRWRLAFYVSNFFANNTQHKAAQALSGKTPRHIINLRQLTQYTPQMAQAQYGDEGLSELIYLRSKPSALKALMKNPFVIVEENLEASITAHQNGQYQQAYDFAVAAYLEGFELVEPKLKAVDHDLLKKIENAMKDFREQSRDKKQSLVALRTHHNEISKLVAQAQEELGSSELSNTVNFVSSFLILLREGVEAILVLAAIFAVLSKTGRKEMFKYLHLGWIGALVLGGLTWFVAANLLSISGASRELSEGITAIIAAVMLVYVGYWLHRQSSAKQWQSFIHEKITQSLSNKAISGLVLIAFLAVYREVFETILFVNTLWLEADNAAKTQIITGAATAIGLLGLIAWGIFKFSMRLPLKLFFRINAVFLYVLAVVFAGKGIAALQEAGKLPIDSIPFIEIDALGIYPNVESLSVQAFLILLALIFYLGNQFKRDGDMEKTKKAL